MPIAQFVFPRSSKHYYSRLYRVVSLPIITMIATAARFMSNRMCPECRGSYNLPVRGRASHPRTRPRRIVSQASWRAGDNHQIRPDSPAQSCVHPDATSNCTEPSINQTMKPRSSFCAQNECPRRVLSPFRHLTQPRHGCDRCLEENYLEI